MNNNTISGSHPQFVVKLEAIYIYYDLIVIFFLFWMLLAPLCYIYSIEIELQKYNSDFITKNINSEDKILLSYSTFASNRSFDVNFAVIRYARMGANIMAITEDR